MISKELLSEVLNVDVKDIYGLGASCSISASELSYSVHRNGDLNIINIHELAHKCKEWAVSVKHGINSSVDGFSKDETNGFSSVYLMDDPDKILQDFYAYTEPEAIFKACEWILKETK